MNTRTMKWTDAAKLCVFTAMLSACGESDLVDIHEQALEDGIAAANVPAAALPTPFDVSGYDLVFSDEFNGNSLDERNWVTAPANPESVIYNQLQYYVDTQDSDEVFDSPFSFDGEHLTISATTTPSEQLSSANGQSYLSGLLSTKERFDLTYGYIEARISVSQGLGIWPALWMLAADADGLRPEIYILEYDGSKPDSAFHTYNYVDANGTLRSPGQQEVQVAGFSEGFHTVGLRWKEGELLYFVDGQAVWRVIGENVPDEDMYLILNLAMGGLWPGAPDATTPDPAEIKIDYLRVYQLRNP